MLRVFILALGITGCAGNVRGVCIYTEDGLEQCTDGLSKLGCDNGEGEFTKGELGDAATDCPDAGFTEECGTGATGGSTEWTKPGECDGSETGDDTGT